MNEVIIQALSSWPAMICFFAFLIILILILKFPDVIRKKIENMVNLGGNKGANWHENPKSKLPTEGYEQIQEKYLESEETISDLRKEKDKLIDIAQGLNRELEDTRVMLFFERVIRAMTNWQYFLLKLGCERKDKTITLGNVLIKIRKAYPDFDQYVTADNLIATLEDLQVLHFISAIRPYTEETPIEFTELTSNFLKYLNTGILTK